VEREIGQGDFVMLDVHGKLRKPAEGDEELDLSRDGYPVFVREESKADEWPFPGFSAKLVGLTPGQETSFSHKYSKDAQDERLRGKSVAFQVTVKTVRGVKLPELNDEFAKTVGGGETLAELRERIRENLERQSKAEYDDKYFLQLFDLIKQGATISYPPQVLEHETEHVMEELSRRLGEQHMDLETYFKVRNTDRDKFMAEEAHPTAKRRLERSLMIDEIAREQKIELSEDEVTSAFQQDWAALSATDEKFQKLTKGGKRANRDVVNAVVMDAANRTMVARVLDYIKLVATGQAPAEEGTTAEAEIPKPKKRARKKKETEESAAPASNTDMPESGGPSEDDAASPGSLT
jgi:trigger factor